MNKMKCLCLFVVVALLTGNVFAAESSEVNVIRLQKTPQSVMSLNIGYPKDYEKSGTVYIVPAESLESAKSGDMSSAVFMGEDSLTDSKASFSFLMPAAAANGVYAAVSGESDESGSIEERIRYFRYNSDAALVESRLSELNAAGDFKTALIGGSDDGWFINTQASAWTNSEAAIVSLMKSMKNGGFNSVYAVEEAFLVACDIAGIKNVSTDRIIADAVYYNDILGFDISNADFNKYPEQTAEKFKTITANGAVTNVTEAKNNFRAACALACMSNSDRTTAIENLKNYNDVFKLDFSGNFTKVDTYELAKVFENVDYTSVEQVREQFSAEINRLINANGGTNGGNSGGTGGGFGGGSGSSGGSGGAGMSNIYTGPGAGLVEGINTVSNVFSDVQGNHWAAEQIRFVYENKIMTGDAEGTFRPEDKITREEWAKVVLSAFSIENDGEECDFKDVDKTQWYYPFVAKAYILGIVNGIDEESFGVGKPLTRQDAVVMMHRATEMARDIRAVQPAELSFSDTDEIYDYALNPIRIFVAMNVINGYENGKFAPQGSVTRAEAAKIICSLLSNVD